MATSARARASLRINAPARVHCALYKRDIVSLVNNSWVRHHRSGSRFGRSFLRSRQVTCVHLPRSFVIRSLFLFARSVIYRAFNYIFNCRSLCLKFAICTRLVDANEIFLSFIDISIEKYKLLFDFLIFFSVKSSALVNPV